MSRVRTGITSDAWRIEDPATPHRSPGSYSVPAENVGSMRPILMHGGIKPNMQFREPPPLRGSGLDPEPTPVCDITMPNTGERCARFPGHTDSHRSRWVMDDEARRRRATRA